MGFATIGSFARADRLALLLFLHVKAEEFERLVAVDPTVPRMRVEQKDIVGLVGDFARKTRGALGAPRLTSGSQHIAASAVRPKIEIGRCAWVAIACGDPATKDHNMSNDNSPSLPELNNRIAILQNNIRQLVHQAAGSAGARDEERISDRIAQQNEELEKLT